MKRVVDDEQWIPLVLSSFPTLNLEITKVLKKLLEKRHELIDINDYLRHDVVDIYHIQAIIEKLEKEE